MTSAVDYQSQVEKIRASALEKIDAAKTQTIGSPSLGDVVRQGDLYLVCLDDNYQGEKVVHERKLAPGTSQGSRHVLEGDVTIWESNPVRINGEAVHEALRGPSFRCNEGSTLTHPEHGDMNLPNGTTWGVVYQRVHAEEVRRVQD
jgi:hypothetical protein